MNHDTHLFLEQACLLPASEWRVSGSGWRFVWIEQGEAYWRGKPASMELRPDDVLIIPPQVHGVLRASQLGAVTLSISSFDRSFSPDC